ncbi:MAG TPA: NAD(P)-dependent oxidoreductase [Anaerolineae bacterium]|jgi:phosphoglycerate dehydrogenase-like enzyme|nr:NAD(P)-dependent oxidoreductase [Anaerolineae bacterium]
MKLLIVSYIDPAAVEKLSQEHDVICAYDPTPQRLKQLIADRDTLVFRSGVSIDAEVMDSAPNLRWLIRAGSGTDNIDLDYVRERGLELVRIPRPGAQAVAELSFALMLALSRNLLAADRSMRQGRWAKYDMVGSLLEEKVLGIVGVGNTGTRTAEIGVAWGMDVIGCVEHPSPARAAELARKRIRLTDFAEVMSASDYVSVHVPITPETRNMIDAPVLSQMRPGSYLISLGRGGVVDERALRDALVGGYSLKGAAVDVHEVEHEGSLSPLVGLDNVILTPHIGAMVIDTQRQIGQEILRLVSSFSAAELPAAQLQEV